MTSSSPRRPTFDHQPLTIAHASCLVLVAVVLVLFVTTPTFAQSGPWENAVTVLKLSFTNTISKALSLIAIVVGGISFAFGEGGSKRLMAGIVFGVGMAVGAVNFMSWLFP